MIVLKMFIPNELFVCSQVLIAKLQHHPTFHPDCDGFRERRMNRIYARARCHTESPRRPAPVTLIPATVTLSGVEV